jgi:RimJ/RimL family protein N-acetyltransferase
MIVRPWTLGDTERLHMQPAQEYLGHIVNVGVDFTELANHGFAWTAEHDGQVIAIAGVLPQWENRATAWALIAKSAGEHFKAIHDAVVEFLDRAPFRRIDATVDVGFTQGHRWIKMLGFELEGYMRAYRPDGADMLLYARVRS